MHSLDRNTNPADICIYYMHLSLKHPPSINEDWWEVVFVENIPFCFSQNLSIVCYCKLQNNKESKNSWQWRCCTTDSHLCTMRLRTHMKRKLAYIHNVCTLTYTQALTLTHTHTGMPKLTQTYTQGRETEMHICTPNYKVDCYWIWHALSTLQDI